MRANSASVELTAGDCADASAAKSSIAASASSPLRTHAATAPAGPCRRCRRSACAPVFILALGSLLDRGFPLRLVAVERRALVRRAIRLSLIRALLVLNHL